MGNLAARNAAMMRLELPDSRVSQSHQRRLGNPCIIDRYGQWVASTFNDLHPQREATIAHSLPHAVQQKLIILAGLQHVKQSYEFGTGRLRLDSGGLAQPAQ